MLERKLTPYLQRKRWREASLFWNFTHRRRDIKRKGRVQLDPARSPDTENKDKIRFAAEKKPYVSNR